MKISVSLPTVEVEFLDDYGHQHDFGSRSATLQHAITLLREADLSDAYEEAWNEWDSGEDAALWEVTVADGLRSV